MMSTYLYTTYTHVSILCPIHFYLNPKRVAIMRSDRTMVTNPIPKNPIMPIMPIMPKIIRFCLPNATTLQSPNATVFQN